jgi:transposase
MPEYKDIIQRLRLRQGVREIQRDTGIHRTIIRAVRGTAEVEGWLDEGRPLPTEQEIQNLRAKALCKKETHHPLYAYLEEFRRWVKEKHSYAVMHQLIAERYPCSEATVRRFVQRYFPQSRKPVMVRATVAGRDMEVDFGYLGISYDPQTRRNRKTYVFSGRLRHSRLAYRETGFGQKARAFYLGHMHAFEYFGGVPATAIPDNLKAAVIKASHQDPLVNRVYRELAEHYGFLISPCPPYEPKKKGGVENDIKYVKKNFWPVFKEKQRALGHDVPRYDDLVAELSRWSREVSETRFISGVGRSPREIFETEERHALKNLPDCRWDPVSWAQPKVADSYLVQFEKAFYSAPYKFIGEQVVVLGTMHTVRIFSGFAEIARHERATRAWQIVRNPLHAPPELEQYMQTTSQGLIQWSYRLGEAVGKVAQRILSDKAVDGMKPVRALVRLAAKYSAQRLERACSRALLYETASYASVKSILVKNLDMLACVQPVDSSGQRVFRFQRHPKEFDPVIYSDSRN